MKYSVIITLSKVAFSHRRYNYYLALSRQILEQLHYGFLYTIFVWFLTLTCLAWVTLSGVYTPAIIALRILKHTSYSTTTTCSFINDLKIL